MQLDLRTKLDRYDRAIVRALQLDGRITNSQLAEGVSLSESACLRRVRALEEAGLHGAHQSAKGRLPGQRLRQHHARAAGTGALARF
jgi:predicted ArsR family transcriptional regulator